MGGPGSPARSRAQESLCVEDAEGQAQGGVKTVS